MSTESATFPFLQPSPFLSPYYLLSFSESNRSGYAFYLFEKQGNSERERKKERVQNEKNGVSSFPFLFFLAFFPRREKWEGGWCLFPLASSSSSPSLLPLCSLKPQMEYSIMVLLLPTLLFDASSSFWCIFVEEGMVGPL